MMQVNFFARIIRGLGTPNKNIRRCVRTAAVLAVLSHLISTEHDASAFSKAGSILFSLFSGRPLFFSEKMSVVK